MIGSLDDDDKIGPLALAAGVLAARQRADAAIAAGEPVQPCICYDCGLRWGAAASGADAHLLFVQHRRSGECARVQIETGGAQQRENERALRDAAARRESRQRHA